MLFDRLSSSAVAALEALATLAAPTPAATLKEAYTAAAVRRARMCYDHLAGCLGVCITEALVRQGALVPRECGYDVTASGIARLAEFGVDVRQVAETARRTRRPLARACIDWSERRPHLAGALGAALATRLLELGWLERSVGSRAVGVTNEGCRALRRYFDVQVL